MNLDLLTDEEFEELCRQLEIDYDKFYFEQEEDDE